MSAIRKLNIASRALRLVTAGSEWQEAVQTWEKMPAGKAPRGINEVFDWFAQVYNGGVDQYLGNGYGTGFEAAITYLKSLGGDAERFAKTAERVSPPMSMDRDDFDEFQRQFEVDGVLDEDWYPSAWEVFEDLMYGAEGNKVVQQIAEDLNRRASE